VKTHDVYVYIYFHYLHHFNCYNNNNTKLQNHKNKITILT